MESINVVSIFRYVSQGERHSGDGCTVLAEFLCPVNYLEKQTELLEAEKMPQIGAEIYSVL